MGGGAIFVNNKFYPFSTNLTSLTNSYHEVGVRVTASLISLIVDDVVMNTRAPTAGLPTFNLPCAIAVPGHQVNANVTIMSLISLSLEDNDNPANNLYLDATASDHTNGGGAAPYPQPIIVDTVGGSNATGVGFSTTDLGYWIDLGGGSLALVLGVGISEELTYTHSLEQGKVLTLSTGLSENSSYNHSILMGTQYINIDTGLSEEESLLLELLQELKIEVPLSETSTFGYKPTLTGGLPVEIVSGFIGPLVGNIVTPLHTSVIA